MGLRSPLPVVPVYSRQGSGACHQAGILSKRRAAYTLDDVPVARLIADSIAVVVAHEQLAEAERARLDARVVRGSPRQPHSQPDGGQRTAPRPFPVIGQSPEWATGAEKSRASGVDRHDGAPAGESGTGKEVVARFIHRASRGRTGRLSRSIAPRSQSNCSSQSCLVRTWRVHGRPSGEGRPFELASTGVLFLDEVSEMSTMAQAKLLRVSRSASFSDLVARDSSRPMSA